MMTDTAPVAFALRWPNGQLNFVHLGIDGDFLHNKYTCSDDALNKFLGSHLGFRFHDSLYDNNVSADSIL